MPELDFSKLPDKGSPEPSIDFSKLPDKPQAPPPPTQEPWYSRLLDSAMQPLAPEAEPYSPWEVKPGNQGYATKRELSLPERAFNAVLPAYNEVVRPFTSPAALASMGAEGTAAIIARRRYANAVNARAAAYQEPAPVEPIVQTPEVLPPMTETYNGPRQLPATPSRLGLPAKGETSPVVEPRKFYQGKKGITSTSLKYPVDVTEPSREPGWNPYSPEGEVVNLDPMYVAEEGPRFGEQAKSIKTDLANNKGFEDTGEPNYPIATQYMNPDEAGLYGRQESGLTYGNVDPNTPEGTSPFGLSTEPIERGAPTKFMNKMFGQDLPSAIKPVLAYKPGGEAVEPVRPVGTPFRADTLTPEESQGLKASRPAEPPPTEPQPVEPVEAAITPALKAGEATPGGGNNIRPLTTNFGSPDRVLREHPESAGVAEPIIQAQNDKTQWVRANLNDASQFIKGLGKAARETIGKVLDTGNTAGVDPDLVARASGIRAILDKVHKSVQGVPGGQPTVGYITNYFTHMAKDDNQPGLIRSAINLVKETALPKTMGSGVGNMYGKGLGNPSSPYVLTRTGQRTQIDYDVRNVLPKYLESIGRYKFDKPAVDRAKVALGKIPDGSITKEMASWYIKNYTRYDSEVQLHKAFNDFATAAANVTARSFIDFNPFLHMLHAGELPSSVWPELGTKYASIGLGKVIASPIQTFKEMAKLGLLQGEAKPWAFRTASERYQSAAQFFNTVETVVKGTAYNGAKKMFLDQHMSPAEAVNKALDLTKRTTYVVDPSTQMKGLSPESNWMGGEGGSKIIGQFKGIPTKVVEQMALRVANAKKEPMKAARTFAGVTAMIGAAQQGAHTFHINPSYLLEAGAPFLTAMGTIGHDIFVKKDLEKALEDTMYWAVPGGRTLAKLNAPPDE